jgi:sensor histidine kinase YesM
MSIEFCYLAFITADYYIIHHFLVHRFLLERKYILFGLTVAGTIMFSAALRSLVAWVLNRTLFHTVAPPGPGQLYTNSVVNIAIWVLLITGGKMLLEKIRHEQQLERLERERVESELAFLKAQINPHSLFNSLNTVYGHIDKSNYTARDTLLQFSELLRYQLYDCGSDKVSLEKEIAYLRNYVDFQRLRKNETLVVDFESPEPEAGLQIAPLLLIVLVENAFKFVSNFTDKENRITIRIHTSRKVLYGSIVNTKERLQAIPTKNSHGIGITNLKRRLDLLYGNRYEFTTDIAPEVYKANLIIDLT